MPTKPVQLSNNFSDRNNLDGRCYNETINNNILHTDNVSHDRHVPEIDVNELSQREFNLKSYDMPVYTKSQPNIIDRHVSRANNIDNEYQNVMPTGKHNYSGVVPNYNKNYYNSCQNSNEI